MEPSQAIIVAPRPSNSARLLAERLGCRYTSRPFPRLKRNTKLVISWGKISVRRQPGRPRPVTLNHYIDPAVNKKHFFIKAVNLPNLLEYRLVASPGMFADNAVWFQRTVMTGHSGEGIVVCHRFEDVWIEPSMLFTKYFDKTHEFRFHMFKDRCIDVVQKKKRNGVVTDGLIRNHGNGWVFAHNDLSLTSQQQEYIISVLQQYQQRFNLDFGAYDILCKIDSNGQLLDWKVCEINTAPGLQSTPTIEAYANAFTAVMNEIN